MNQSFAQINRVPQSTDLIDIAFSKTNRGTPTVVHARFQINRIRRFYVRKVKFSSEQFCYRLRSILQEFPVLEDIHPFYMDLINVLYDRDHYKIALGQINTASHRVSTIAKEHVRLLNFADSLYRCKELKRAALGQMATTVKKLAEPLKYLEEVRQHMTRLPSIDPTTRTVVICGFPNVGKSTFMNAVTKAHVDVQPYAFTTKSIYVGHFEYKSLRWQILDTPGILDRPLQDRNSVEMLSITALAHLKSAVLFFMDLSETCGYPIAEQMALYENLTPLLNQEIVVVLAKSDILAMNDVSDPRIIEFLKGKKFYEMSVHGEKNVECVKEAVCDALLESRIAQKEDRVGAYMNRIKPYVPSTINEKYEGVHLGRNPFAGVPENESYFCDEKYDVIPEIYDGKNISDFIDPNIRAKLEAVIEQVGNEELRRYDILSAEERQKYEDVNSARINAIMRAHFDARSRMPARVRNRLAPSGELARNEAPVLPVVKVEKPVFNKKVQRNGERAYTDARPRHILRPRGSKFARK